MAMRAVVLVSMAGCASTVPVDTLDRVGGHSSIAIGTDRMPVIAYYDDTSGDLKVSHCLDLACVRAEAAVVDSVGDVGKYTSITIGADGLPVIAYHDIGGGFLKVARCLNLRCSAANVSVVRDESGTAQRGQFASLILGGDGLPLIAFFNMDAGNLGLARCLNADCRTARVTAVDASPDVGRFASLARSGDGLFISYFDMPAARLKFARCNDSDCGAPRVTVIDPSPVAGLFSSIEIGADGLPVMGYYDSGANVLKAAHCGDIDCTTPLITVVERGGGAESTLAIGEDGLPIIAFAQSGTPSGLKVVHCGDSSCTRSDSYTLDAATDIARSLSVTIGFGALPVMSYNDFTRYDLKVAHCHASSCEVVVPATEAILDIVHFTPGGDLLVPAEANRIFMRINELLRAEPGLEIFIDGHTDPGVSPEYSLGISQRRANAIRDRLVQMGAPARRLHARGFGDSRSVLPNDSADHRTLNRRVEFRQPF